MFFLVLELLYIVFIMLINVKMPTIVGILSSMSRISLMLSRVEHASSFINLVPGHAQDLLIFFFI